MWLDDIQFARTKHANVILDELLASHVSCVSGVMVMYVHCVSGRYPLRCHKAGTDSPNAQNKLLESTKLLPYTSTSVYPLEGPVFGDKANTAAGY